jgi:hypothetical protein
MVEYPPVMMPVDPLGCRLSAACSVAMAVCEAGVNAKIAPTAKPCVQNGVAAIAAAVATVADSANWRAKFLLPCAAGFGRLAAAREKTPIRQITRRADLRVYAKKVRSSR